MSEVKAEFNIDKRTVAKVGTQLVVCAGVDKVIDDIIDATAPAEVKPLAKIFRKIGSIAIGWLIGDYVWKETSEMYDEIMKLSDEYDKKEETENG